MVDIEAPNYLSTPRYDEAELEFIREQAEFYNHMKQQDEVFSLMYVLIPACSKCGSDKLVEDRYRLANYCVNCKNEDSSFPVRTGRIAKR